MNSARMMKYGAWVTTALMASVVCLSDAAAQAPDKEFTIAIGETLTFSGRNVVRVTVGLPEIASVKPTSDDKQILVTGIKPGVTTINVYSSSSQKTLLIRVVPINPTTLAQEARDILGDRSGVDVRVIKGRVVLEGEVSSEAYKKRIDKLAELYPNQVLNFATYRESFVEGAKMVALEVDFVQLASTGRDRLGVNWGQFFGANMTFGAGDVALYYDQQSSGGSANTQNAFGPGILPGERNPARLPPAVNFVGGSGLNGYMSLVGNLNLALDFLVENGLVRTRQHGVIVTEAGTEGEYHTGGTLLIRLLGAQSVGLQEIPYGLRVKVKPIVDVDNRVKLQLEAIYSEIDAANGVGEVPALRNTEVKGTVNMQEGQSVLVSGITGTTSTSNEQGWWLLGSIPILGWAFKSRSFIEQQLNNALFVTPRIYEPGGKVHDALVRGVFEEMIKNGYEPTDLPELSKAPATPRAVAKPPSSDGSDKTPSTDSFDE